MTTGLWAPRSQLAVNYVVPYQKRIALVVLKSAYCRLTRWIRI